jgi:hypothetical protein
MSEPEPTIGKVVKKAEEVSPAALRVGGMFFRWEATIDISEGPDNWKVVSQRV